MNGDCIFHFKDLNHKNSRKTVMIEFNQEAGVKGDLQRIGTIKYELPHMKSYIVEVSNQEIAKLRRLKGVIACHECGDISAKMDRALHTIHGENTGGYLGQGIGIAVLDTGISPVNDFTLPQDRIVAFRDFVNGRRYPYDDNGHGTQVTCIYLKAGSA